MKELTRVLKEGSTKLTGLSSSDRKYVTTLLKMASMEAKPISQILVEQNQISIALLGLIAKYASRLDEIEDRLDQSKARLLEALYNRAEVEGTRPTNNWIDMRMSLDATDEHRGLSDRQRRLKVAVSFLRDFRDYVERSRSSVAIQMSVNERGENGD